MQSWENIKAGTTRNRTYVMPKALRDAGLTIDTINNVSAIVHPDCEIQDGSPGAVVAGSPQKNATAFTLGIHNVAVGQAVIVPILGRTLHCSYVVTFNLILSDGTPFSEDCQQFVTQFEPVP